MKKMILAMPSSGSDFFARAVARATGWSYYDKEWFNPMCNLSRYDRLVRAGCGCETVGAYERISWPEVWTHIDDVVQEFSDEGYVLDKEVFGHSKIQFFRERGFDCIALVRSAESMFPPSRLRVLQWYDAIARSHGTQDKGDFLESVYYGYRICRTLLEGSGLTVVDYDSMLKFGCDQIRDWIGGEINLMKFYKILVNEGKAKKKELEPTSVVYRNGKLVLHGE